MYNVSTHARFEGMLSTEILLYDFFDDFDHYDLYNGNFIHSKPIVEEIVSFLNTTDSIEYHIGFSILENVHVPLESMTNIFRQCC